MLFHAADASEIEDVTAPHTPTEEDAPTLTAARGESMVEEGSTWCVGG